MAHLPRDQYLKTQVLTASPEALQLLLWDGAIRFAQQGREAIIKKDIEGSYKMLLKAQRIITEMNTGLKHSVDPGLCGKMASLYNFIFRRLVDANTKKDIAAVDDALRIMRHQRETWVMVMEKLGQERALERAADATALGNAAAMGASDLMPVATADTIPKNSAAKPMYAGAGKTVALAAARLSIQG